MRNALVLVPLCIGLTFGFIVPTRTAVANEFTESILKSEGGITVSNKEDELITKSIDSITSGVLQVYPVKEEVIKNALYSYGSADDKNINERSLVFVNQRWEKVPYRSQSVETKQTSPNFNKNKTKITATSKTYQEDQRKSLKNIYNKMGNVHINNIKPKPTKNERFTNKTYFPPVDQLESKDYFHHNIKHNIENQESNKHKISATKSKNLNSDPNHGLVDLKRNNKIRIYNRPSYDNTHPVQRNKGIYDFSTVDINRQKLTQEASEIYQIAPLFKDKTHGQMFEVLNEDSLRSHKHTMEQQIPAKGLPQNYAYNNKLSNFKYCQECIWKGKFKKVTDYFDVECKCKCGRYIHLRGSPDLKEYTNKRRHVFDKNFNENRTEVPCYIKE